MKNSAQKTFSIIGLCFIGILIVIIGGIRLTSQHSKVSDTELSKELPASAGAQSILLEPVAALQVPIDSKPESPEIWNGTPEIAQLQISDFNYSADDISEWEVMADNPWGGTAIRGILELQEGRAYFEASSANSETWDLRVIAFLGEFVLQNTSFTDEFRDSVKALGLGEVTIMDQNRLFSRVSLPIQNLQQATLLNAWMDQTLPEGSFDANSLVYPVAAPDDPGYSGSWTLAKLDLEPVWDAYGFSPESNLGRRAVIAVVDNGAPFNSEFHTWTNNKEIPGNGIDDDGNWRIDDVNGYNFVRDSGDLSYSGSHGTNVAKIAAGLTNNGKDSASPASSASLMRVLFYESVSGSHFDAVDGILYAIDNGADVINCSFISTSSISLQVCVDFAELENSVIVAAAGNDGKSLESYPLFPAALDGNAIITVGASTSTDARGKSNWSATKVDIFAPGTATSYSTPLVSSAVALLRSLSPNASSSELRSAIINGADYSAALDGLCVANGRLNVRGSVESLLGVSLGGNSAPTPPNAPSLSIDSVGESSITLSWNSSEQVGSFEVEVSTQGGTFAALEPTAMFEGNSTGVIVNGLESSTEYTFRIRAFNGALASNWVTTTPVTTLVPTPVAPSAPSLAIGTVGIGTIELSWSGESDVTSFELQVSEAGASFGSTTSYAGSESGVQLNGLGEGVSYKFRLRAVRGGLSSGWTTSASVTTLESAPVPVAPSAPSLAIGTVGIGTIELSWSGEADVTSFELQVSEAGASFGSTTSYAGSKSGVQLNGLGEGVSYKFRLRAVRGGLTSGWTTSASVTTLESAPVPVAPSAPSLVIGTVGIGTIELSWSGEADVTSFELQVSEAGASFGSTTSYAGSKSGVQLNGLGEGVSYKFRLRAVRGGLTSGWTTSASVTTLESAPVPVAPSAPSLVIGAVGVGTIDLSWSGEADVTSFELQVSEAGASFGSTTSYAGSKSGVQLNGLGEGVSYKFRLRAVRGGLTSGWTTSASVTTLESAPVSVAPSAPRLVLGTVGVGTIDLSWNGEEDMAGVELQVSEAGSKFGSTMSFAGNESSTQLSGLGEGVEYRFRIRALRDGLYSTYNYTPTVVTEESTVVAPNAPSISIDNVGIGSIDLSWSSEAGVASFELQMSEAGAEFADLKLPESLSGDQTSVQLLGLGEGVSYAFRIRAVKEGIPSEWALSSTVTTLEPAPQAPDAPALNAFLVDISSVSLSWSVGKSVDGFELQISEAGAAYEDLEAGLVLSKGDTSLLVEDLLESENYQFRIRAIKSGLVSSWTESETIKTKSAPWATPDHNWKFNGGSELIAYDSGSLALDLSLGSEPGISWGEGVGYTQTGLDFNGSHMGIEIPDSEAINLSAQKALTISLWVKASGNPARNTSVLYEQGGFWRGLNLIVDKGWLLASGWNRPVKESDWAGTTLQGGKLRTGQWNHVVLVLNAAETIQENGLTLYVNGSSVASGPASMVWANMEKTGIGQVRGGTVYRDREVRSLDPFEGSIDNLNIWCCALSPEEIKAVYESASAN